MFARFMYVRSRLFVQPKKKNKIATVAVKGFRPFVQANKWYKKLVVYKYVVYPFETSIDGLEQEEEMSGRARWRRRDRQMFTMPRKRTLYVAGIVFYAYVRAYRPCRWHNTYQVYIYIYLIYIRSILLIYIYIYIYHPRDTVGCRNLESETA